MVYQQADDLAQIFQAYDKSGDGRLDCNEWVNSFNVASSDSISPPVKVNARPSTASNQEHLPKPQPTGDDLNSLMRLFRDRLKARGARGIIGLQRIFAIMDDDGSKTLNVYEFTKACRDFRIGISDENIPTIFNAFDTNRDGTVSYDEFLRAVRGDMNDARMALVQEAFRKLDKDGSGSLDLIDIRKTYRADKHPDVL